MTRHAALFDLDGVLIDSESVYTVFWDKIEKKYPTGIPDFANAIKGSTLNKIMDLYKDQKVKENVLELLKEQERTMQFDIFDGVVDFLEDLKAHDIPCAIVTSSNERKMEKLFHQHPKFKDYFKVIVTDRQVTRSKPDPQGYLLAASQLECDPANCCVFEDSYFGLEAGRRSGAKVVALSTTNPASTLEGKADKIVSSFKQLTVDELF
ncbi:MAG: HAD family phosphatase [Muribaculaceae bacterium]|nr:HAD family phosphatase [Muribaculaceae bacterium]